MISTYKYGLLFVASILLLVILSLLHLSVGESNLTVSDFWNSIFHYDQNNTNLIIARDFRIPRLVMAIISGAGLSIAGLLMQNLFNNPLAGPNILGISTGSSLFVAFSIMSGIPFFTSDLGIVTSALIGAMVFGVLILTLSVFSKSHTSLLLIGIMIGSFSGAFVSVLQTLSDAQELKVYAIWAMGSLQQVNFEQLPLIFGIFVLGVAASFFLIKSLNAMSLGAENAILLGVRYANLRITIIGITAIITGLVTAFCGPIAFVGLAVPNLVKIIFRTQDHFILILGSLIIGSSFLIICDIIIQVLDAYINLPINAITSMIGAPFVIFIILKRLS